MLSPVIIVWFNTLRGTMRAPAEELLRQNTLRGPKIAFLTTKSYHEHPSILYGVTPCAPLPPPQPFHLRYLKGE